jgi:hypothetical protein
LWPRWAYELGHVPRDDLFAHGVFERGSEHGVCVLGRAFADAVPVERGEELPNVASR